MELHLKQNVVLEMLQKSESWAVQSINTSYIDVNKIKMAIFL